MRHGSDAPRRVMRKAGIVWFIGLVTVVPYATWHLFLEAPREQYALLITFILFWIFGYFGLVAPIVMLLKLRRVFRAMERAGSRDEALRAIRSPEARDVAIDLLASENRIPRFLAARLHELLVRRLAEGARAPGRDTIKDQA
jgi:hypothetical protein